MFTSKNDIFVGLFFAAPWLSLEVCELEIYLHKTQFISCVYLSRREEKNKKQAAYTISACSV